MVAGHARALLGDGRRVVNPVTAFYHGGIPGLRPGDLIEPGYDRPHHPGCPWCEARATEKDGGARALVDGLSREHGVYITTHRLYAKHYASLYGRGDLYRVEPVGEARPSAEDTLPTFVTAAARVQAVLDRAVLLTWSERRRLNREWAAADAQWQAVAR